MKRVNCYDLCVKDSKPTLGILLHLRLLLLISYLIEHKFISKGTFQHLVVIEHGRQP